MTTNKKRKKMMAVELPPIQNLQLEFFPPTEIEVLSRHVDELKESANKVRKGVFARHTKLAKEIDEIKCQLNELKISIQNLGNLATSVTPAPKNLDLHQGEASTHIISISAEYAKPSNRLRQREIITDLYQLDFFAECK